VLRRAHRGAGPARLKLHLSITGPWAILVQEYCVYVGCILEGGGWEAVSSSTSVHGSCYFAALFPSAGGKTSTAINVDKTLPKELRVSNPALRQRRQAAMRSGFMNDFNPTCIDLDGTKDMDVEAVR
jgi:hypothetical protein